MVENIGWETSIQKFYMKENRCENMFRVSNNIGSSLRMILRAVETILM